MSIYSDSWTWVDTPPETKDSEFYTCIIVCPDRGLTIKANLPSEYQIDFGVSYESSFSQSISEEAYAGAKKIGGALGYQFATKAMTGKVFQGSNDVQFTIPLIFQIETDPVEDILKPLSQLYSLVLPKMSDAAGLLESPGPVLDLELLKKGFKERVGLSSKLRDSSSSLANSAQVSSSQSTGVGDPTAWLMSCVKNNCYLYIGQYQYFSSVVLTSISQTTSVLPHYEAGTMSRVEVAVTFTTMWVPTQEDIKDLLLGSSTLSEENEPTTISSLNPSLNVRSETAFQADMEVAAAGGDESLKSFLQSSGYF